MTERAVSIRCCGCGDPGVVFYAGRETAGADVGDRLRDALQRRKAEPHLEDRGQQQHDAERGKGAAEVVVEAARLVENLAGVTRDGDEVPTLVLDAGTGIRR